MAHFQGELLDASHGDTAGLDELLDDRLTLTHLTGHGHAKAGWLAEMRAEQLRYHPIDQREPPSR